MPPSNSAAFNFLLFHPAPLYWVPGTYEAGLDLQCHPVCFSVGAGGWWKLPLLQPWDKYILDKQAVGPIIQQQVDRAGVLVPRAASIHSPGQAGHSQHSLRFRERGERKS